jgi:hypothetical protein
MDEHITFYIYLSATAFGSIQAWFTVFPRASIQVAPIFQSPQTSSQTHLLIPLAPIKPLELDVVLKKEEK